jgi:hypothetical protein
MKSSKTISILLFVPLLMISCSDQKVINDWSSLELKGEVRSLRETYYGVYDSLRVFDKEKKRSFNYTEFNELGFVESKTISNSYPEYTYSFKNKYEYNTNGKPILVESKILSSQDGNSIVKYIHNKSQNSTETIEYAENKELVSRSVHYYDEDKKPLYTLQFDERDSLEYTLKFLASNKERIMRVYENGEIINSIKDIYDNSDRIISKMWIAPDSTVTSLSKYVYDDNYLIEFSKEDFNYNYKEIGIDPKSIDKYSYVIDEKGNWIERITHSKQPFSGEKILKVEREIQYFE